MQMERIFAHTSEPGQSGFCIAPEALDSVNMTFAINKFILPVVDSKMLFVTKINQAVIASPAIRMNNTFQTHSSAYNLLQRGSTAIRDDLSIDFSVSSEDTKNDSFTESSTASFAFNAASPEKAFINFNLTRKRRLLATKLSDSLSDFCDVPVDCVPVQTGNSCYLRGIQIQ